MGGVDKTSKAKLLLGVVLLGTSSAAAMNLDQLQHEKLASSIKETSQDEPSENNRRTAVKIRQFRKVTSQKRRELTKEYEKNTAGLSLKRN